MNESSVVKQSRETVVQINKSDDQIPPHSKQVILTGYKSVHKTFEEVASIMKTDLKEGLSEEESDKRLLKYGENVLPEEKPPTLLKIFMKQFYDFMLLILLISGAISIGIGDWIEAVVLLAVVTANVLIGFIQESKAEKALADLRSLTVPKATLIRGGEHQVIAAKLIVVGDLVILEEGCRIPADIRLIESINLQAMEAILTGESEPVDKVSELIQMKKGKKPIPVADRVNMAFMSTIVTRGHGRGIVVGTGKHTEVGMISHELQRGQRVRNATPLQRRLSRLGRMLVVISVVLCAVVMGIGLLRIKLEKGKVTGNDVLQYAKVGISLAVSVIPEGLVAVVTVTMALGVQRMAKRQAVVRKLSAVETLGSVTALCCDKTGTLTEGKMKTEEYAFPNGEAIGVTGSGISPEGDFVVLGKDEKVGKISTQLRMALINSALCNNAKVQYNEENSTWEPIGDPTEVALQVAAQKVQLDKETLENGLWKKRDEAAFDSDRKRMTVIYKIPASEKLGNYETLALTKGAFETMVKVCKKVQLGDHVESFSEEMLKKVHEQSHVMASKGLRVLALAYKPIDQGTQETYTAAEHESNMIFLGQVGLRDPPREQAIQAIKFLRSAGVQVYMITGDHARTAYAIGRQLGIIDANSADDYRKQVIQETEIADMDRGALAKLEPFPKVFARISPSTKLKVVDALHIRGEVTSMIGDGVNDAPALKHCDVGVAMGRNGTDLARQSSAIVLMDDNIMTLVAALEEGRRTFDNIQKFILYLLSCNSSEIWVMLFAVIIGLPTPFTAVMILWANLIIDIPPAMALGIDPIEPDILKRQPRDPKADIFNWKSVAVVLYQGFVMAGLILGLYATTIYGEGYEEPPEINEYGASKSNRARGLAFVSLAILHLLHAFYAKSVKRTVFSRETFNNKWLIGGFLLSMFLIIIVCYIPVLKDILNQWPLNWIDWIHIGILVILHCFFIEAQKLCIKYYELHWKNKQHHFDVV